MAPLRRQCSGEVFLDVLHVLQPDRQAQKALGDAEVKPFFLRQALMRRRRRVGDDAFRIAKIIRDIDDLEGVLAGQARFMQQDLHIGINVLESIPRRGRFGLPTARVWLRITASNDKSTIVHLDGQSFRPRDINDETPIVVTVPLGNLDLSTR